MTSLGSLIPSSRPSSAHKLQQPHHRLWLAVIVVLCLHLLCWRAAAPLRASHHNIISLHKRAFNEHEGGGPAPGPDEESAALINWLALYDQASPSAKPALFVGMVVWLIFLFAFVGITASDFFCPNLSTIASRLGLSESVAGVTFLAFSNGSPDVFSTFSALSHGSGSLAIGELIGAASFIVSVVAGTMCLIQPFKVSPHTFLRDVGFFTLAITITLTILYDSHIRLWEAWGMVGLYCCYVAFVAVGSWWYARKERREEGIRKAREEYAEEDVIENEGDEYRDEGMLTPSTHLTSPSHTRPTSPALPTPHSHHQTSASAPPTSFPFHLPSSSSHGSPLASPHSAHPHTHQALSDAAFQLASERGTPVVLTRARSGSTSTGPPLRRPKNRSSVRPSLLGAIEFRDVVNSLREDSTARTLAVFGGTARGEEHSHAISVGVERRGRPDGTGESKRPRAKSHSGALHADPSLEDEGIEPPTVAPTLDGLRRTTWAAASVGGGSADWGAYDSHDEGEDDDEGPLIDLSAGVDNPWEGARSPLRIEIPAIPSSAAATRMRSAPPSIRRAASGGSLGPMSPIGNGHGDSKAIRKVPSILLTSVSGTQEVVQPESEMPQSALKKLQHRRGYRIARAVFLALFPSLQDWSSKSWVGKATAVLCVPAILLLNLTLPVVDDVEDDCASLEEKEAREEGDRWAGRYRDDGDDSDDESVRAPREGILIDTDDRHYDHQHHLQSHHPHSDELGTRTPTKHDREFIAHAFHSQVTPHAETPRTPPADASFPWAQSVDAHAVDRQLEQFSFASANGSSPNHVAESTDATPATTPVTAATEATSIVNLEVHNTVVTRWLTAVQCTLGPVFCTTALLIDDFRWWYPLVALASGLALGTFAFVAFEDHRHPGRIMLCFCGFIVAGVWILMIVNEVVGVLQTIGHIFGLSDAILGLTVFAIGNSLGDLVANATVARMGFPSMAIAATFGGPMLNILLGVGLSGTYLISRNGGQPLEIPMGRTLLVSGVGLLFILLSTLILVPLNGFRMDKRLGAGLIAAYTIVLSINIAVEIWL